MSVRSPHGPGKTLWPAILIALVFGALLFMYKDVILGMARQWYEDDNYNHGFLVPIISGLLLYRCLERMPTLRSASLGAALPLIIPGYLLFALGQAAAELFTLRVSMLLVFWGLVRGIWGRALFKSLRFPLLFLIFMVPLPYVAFYRVAFPLQLMSAAASAGVLDFLGVPLVRTGNIIHLSGVSIDVVTACSGLRSLLALITFGTLAAGLFDMRWRLRLLLVLLSVPIAVATNMLRIIITGILVHTSGRVFLAGTLHDALGLLTFALGIGLLFVLGGSFRWRRISA